MLRLWWLATTSHTARGCCCMQVGDSSDSDDDVIALPSRRTSAPGGAGRGRGGRGYGGGAAGEGKRQERGPPQRRSLNYGAAFQGTGAPVAAPDPYDAARQEEEMKAHKFVATAQCRVKSGFDIFYFARVAEHSGRPTLGLPWHRRQPGERSQRLPTASRS